MAAGLFVLSLKWMSSPATARRGVRAGELGMLLAICGDAAAPRDCRLQMDRRRIDSGAIIGVPLGRVQMTAVPQRTALSHAFGALCVTLVGTSEFYLRAPAVPPFLMAVLSLEVILASLTFTGSLMAAGKLQEILPQRPITYRGQNIVNLVLFTIAIGVAALSRRSIRTSVPFPVLTDARTGVRSAADHSDRRRGHAHGHLPAELLCGTLRAAMGFVLDNKLLIIAGALDGSSGFILSVIMSKAMNRSFTNVLFGAFGRCRARRPRREARPVRERNRRRSRGILSAARERRHRSRLRHGRRPGPAQGPRAVRHAHRRGVDVKFAIHPVAGRMPGHMNVLLAEADIPYDRLVEMDEINGDFPQTDVALVIGANDVTNPAARTETSSPIYGMPILDVDKARTVMVIKRGMSPGFAGIDNPLYYLDKTLMLFGDAKSFTGEIVRELSGGGAHWTLAATPLIRKLPISPGTSPVATATAPLRLCRKCLTTSVP